MELRIVNNKSLAQAVGITPQYLSTIKKDYSASQELLNRLVSITQIPLIIWSSPARKNQLDRRLKLFFTSEKSRSN